VNAQAGGCHSVPAARPRAWHPFAGPVPDPAGGGIVKTRLRSKVASAKHWAGYAWFMTLGTVLPLIVFLGGYLAQVTIVGAPVARRVNKFGVWIATFGQEPPGRDKVASHGDGGGKPPLADRIRPYSPQGVVARRGRPVPVAVRVVWFVLVGWWLGAVWVIISWSIFLAPYPFPHVVTGLLEEAPGVMTLQMPRI
jgi:uncharacterized membrane protein YccF (DUF307 family)